MPYIRSLAVFTGVAMLMGTVPALQWPDTAVLAQSVWRRFASPDKKFSVLFPGAPIEVKQPIQEDGWQSTLYMYMVERKQESVLYMTAYIDYPFQFPSEAVPEGLASGREGMLAERGATLISEQAIELNGYPGTEFKYRLPDRSTGRARLYLVNQRLYMLVVETSKEQWLTKSIEGFLSSFQFSL